jgi:SAM-dependent methyltransferase
VPIQRGYVRIWDAGLVAINPFDVGTAAAINYAEARPYYHPLAVALGFEVIGRSTAEVGLDVGCGTGLSTKALAAWARRVVGVDPAAAMLGASPRLRNGIFVRAAAERLPVRTDSVDLVTCAAAMHWFADVAFDELARVTRTRGHVIVYSDFFLGEVVGEPRFSMWMRETYLPRLPTPPRRSYYNEAAMKLVGFRMLAHEQRVHEVSMTASRLAAYLMTQSNATMAIANGAVDEGALRAWIETELVAVLGPEDATTRFGCRVWVAEKSARKGYGS